MFGIFKRKKKRNRQPGISEMIRQALAQGETNLHVNLYVDDQILFQVVPAMHYAERGLNDKELKGFIELHFFHKNKTITKANESFAKKLSTNGVLTYFENPKGIHNYINAIGIDPEEIEKVINKRIDEMYSNIEKNRISIEYAGY